MQPQLRASLRGRLSPATRERTRILRRAARDLLETRRVEPPAERFPVGLEEIRHALASLGIVAGDTLLVHSSGTALFRGATTPPAEPVGSVVDYSRAVIELLLSLVGPEGTLLMPTDSISGIFTFSRQGDIFDSTRAPSRRGWITELFRQRTDVLRSVHPWYNVTACGRLAQDLLADDELSTPYAMDAHSPWTKLNDVDGKILFLGVGLEANSSLHQLEYLHPDEFPHPVFYDKPLPIRYRRRGGEVGTIDVMPHAIYLQLPGWRLFCDYLDDRHGLYERRLLGADAPAVMVRPRVQYDALLTERDSGVTWYDVQYWDSYRAEAV